MDDVPLNIFSDPNFVEPKCPGCKIKLNYGANTKYSDEHETHICIACNTVLKG